MGFLRFAVVGAQKAGTTTFHELLSQNPRICLPRCKETHFFSSSERYRLGWNWYASQFPDISSAASSIRGEVDPDYLSSRDAAARLHENVGDIPIIILIRHPLDRSYSQFRMTRHRGLDDRDFSVALSHEVERLSDSALVDDNHDYVWRSLYSQHIRRYQDFFSHIEIAKFEDLFSADETRRIKTYARLLKVIGERPDLATQANWVHANAATSPRSGQLSKALWNPERGRGFRALQRLIPPSLRHTAWRKLRQWNESSHLAAPAGGPPSPRMDYAALVPESVRNHFVNDLRNLEKMASVDCEDWIASLS